MFEYIWMGMWLFVRWVPRNDTACSCTNPTEDPSFPDD